MQGVAPGGRTGAMFAEFPKGDFRSGAAFATSAILSILP